MKKYILILLFLLKNSINNLGQWLTLLKHSPLKIPIFSKSLNFFDQSLDLWLGKFEYWGEPLTQSGTEEVFKKWLCLLLSIIWVLEMTYLRQEVLLQILLVMTLSGLFIIARSQD